MPLTQSEIEQRRNANYHRTATNRVQTVEAARGFVRETGVCLFAPSRDLEMPNLFHAIAGRVRDVPDAHHDADVSKWWGWKDDSLDKRWWYYGKLVRKRATLVSPEVLPHFYACSSNYGDYEHDYLEEYQDGKLSAEARNIYEVLLEYGRMHTVDLRKKAHLTADNAKYRFERALTELQMGLKVLPVGVAAAGAWRYAFIYDIVARYYPELPAQARPISRAQAQQTLISRHLQNVVVAKRDQVFRGLDVLGWSLREFEQAVQCLLDTGAVREAEVDGIGQALVMAREE